MCCVLGDEQVDEQIRLRDDKIYQLKQRIEELKNKNEELKSQMSQPTIKEEGMYLTSTLGTIFSFVKRRVI